jgi:hypothetical protein
MERTSFSVQIEGQTIPLLIQNEKQTVGSLVRVLEKQFRVENLTCLKIDKLMVGKYPLKHDDLLADVLNNGDVVVAVIKGRREKRKRRIPYFLLQKFHTSMSSRFTENPLIGPKK